MLSPSKDACIAVIMGGRSVEREVSKKTGRAICAALEKKGYSQVMELDPQDKNFITQLASQKLEFAFIALHGKYGEDGCIQGLLEYLDIPYTGVGVGPSALAMDKVQTKKILQQSGVQTPKFVHFRKDQHAGVSTFSEQLKALALNYPLIVKPSSEGSTFGLEKVTHEGDLRSAISKAFSFDDKILIEECIDGSECTVAVLNGSALPIVEIVPKSGFYDYEAKYKKGKTDFYCPARYSEEVTQKLVCLAMNAAVSLGCESFCRVDIMVKDSLGYVLEVNTMPGFTDTSLFPRAAKASGLEFADLVEQILLSASLKNTSNVGRQHA